MVNSKLFLVILIATILSACGGDNSEGNTPTPTPTPVTDTDNDGVGDEQDSDDDNDGFGDAQDAFPLDASESVDTDSDGVGNNADDDDDNDGVLDEEDAFPLDASESVDSDSDGIGNNTDDDDDNDGVLDEEDAFPLDPDESADTDRDGAGNNVDFYPEDAACFKEVNGDGEHCYLTLLKRDYNDLQIFSFGDHIAIYHQTKKTLFRIDAASGDFASPIALELEEVTTLAYSSAHQGYYIGDMKGQIYFLDANGDVHDFYLSDGSVDSLAVAGQFVVTTSSYWMKILDVNGIELSATYVGGSSFSFEWDASTNSLFFYRSDTENANQFWRMELNQVTGEIVEFFRSYRNNSNSSQQSLIVPPSPSNVVFFNGQAYNKTNPQSLGTEVMAPAFHVWNADQSGLITLNYHSGNTLLQWLDGALTKFDEVIIAGAPLGVARSDDSIIVLTSNLQRFHVTSYELDSDMDGDRVNNEDDAFPMDRAASSDSDGDGFPDTWNDGMSESDSTSDLILDAYPDESVCWLERHADATGACNFAATMPDFVPTQVFAGPEDIIFIYSQENKKVYVWDAAAEVYLRPIDVAMNNNFASYSPQQIVYSQAHNRLYFTPDSQTVFALEYSQENVAESSVFYTHPENLTASISELYAVGNYLLLQDVTATHYLIDINGLITDSRLNYPAPSTFAWNPLNNRLYQLGEYGYNLQYVEIGQTSGTFLGRGEAAYPFSSYLTGPIVISHDGQRVILGSGDIYSADDLVWLGTYQSFVQAITLENSEMLFVRQSDNSTELVRVDGQNRLLEERVLQAGHLSLLKTENTALLFLDQQNSFTIEKYIPDNDTDRDGVLNIEDAFPTDIAASVDSDNDGYPDSWNAGYNESDSTSGLTLDAFPEDTACWKDNHSTTESTCDYSATMPDFTPSISIADEQGMVYLFNEVDSTVYRWSAETELFTNPLKVGFSNGLSSTAPTKLAYSEAHRRLYLGYPNGQITYIDLEGSPTEQAFYQLPLEVVGLVAVGDFVLAHDSSGARGTHYVLNENGALTERQEWKRYSRQYTWNAFNSRVYFFRDNTSPNDLHYEEIDQASGRIVAEGETPYHGQHSMKLPITTVNGGQNILIGSGVIFNASDMRVETILDQAFDKAAAFDDIFAVVANESNQTRLQIFRNSSWELYSTQILTAPVLDMFAMQDRLLLISKVGGEFSFTFIQVGDSDGDTLPAWWENTYGLSDSNAFDANLDSDNDDLTNLEEYQLNSNPILLDSDNDGISDGDEFYVYETSVLNPDSDADGLTDGDEILTHGTFPLTPDSDGDGFSDGDEILKYNTNPLSNMSVPEAITFLTESFEDTTLPSIWQSNETSDANWIISTSESTAGNQSARSGDIDHYEKSALVFEGLFSSGTLSFDAKLSSESCCDVLRVYVNGEEVIYTNNSNWNTYSIDLLQGEHIIEWRYEKDGSVSSGEDSAFIDNVVFSQ